MPQPSIYVFEDSQVERLFPLAYVRSPCELRTGAFTLLERLQRNLPGPIAGLLTRSFLAESLRRRCPDLPINPALSTRDGILLVNARWLLLRPDDALQTPSPDTAALSQGSIVWAHLSPELAGRIDLSTLQEPATLESIVARAQRISSNATLINRPWDLLEHQTASILQDFATLGPAAPQNPTPGAHLLNPAQIHIAPNARIWPGAVLDAQNGPIIIGECGEIRANCVITGPAVIGAHAMIRNVADIRENTTIGPGCRVGGEINASIFLGNSNKQHHGFIGNSIIAEWVNLGAGTTTSNVKNTYGTVKVPLQGTDETTGRQFMGSIIADHAKLGIGTYLSTGSVVGFGSHVVVPRPPRFVPSFAWITDRGIERADFAKLEQIADTVLKRRHLSFSPVDHEVWVHIASDYAVREIFQWEDDEPA